MLDGAATLTARGRSILLARGAMVLCPSERTILSMQASPRQCCSKPPFLAIPILSTARSDAAMGLASKQQNTAMSTGLNFSGPERDYVSIRVSAEKSKTVSDLDRKSDT